jgi:antitoxin ParD1/3/4
MIIFSKSKPQKIRIMARQSITLANQNDEWLKNQVTNQEFTSKSEGINYLIKRAREQEASDNYVNMKIERGLNSPLAKPKTEKEMLAEFKARLKNG